MVNSCIISVGMLGKLTKKDVGPLIQAILDETPGQAWLVGPDGRSVLANDRARRSELGSVDRSDKSIVSLPVVDLPVDMDLAGLVSQSFARKQPVVVSNLDVKLPGGDSQRADLRVVPLPTGSAGPLAYVSVTPRRDQAELALQQARDQSLQSLTDLAGKIAHELNNPLDGSIRYINLALRRVQQELDQGEISCKLDEYLSSAKQALDKMLGILSDLGEFARTGQAQIENISINELIDQAVKTLVPQAQSVGVSIVTALTDQLPSAGNTRMYQVFCNLIKNAIDAVETRRKFDPDCPGIITIKTTLVDGTVRITCDDSGVGLTAESARLFEPFFTTKADKGGTGLGLAIAQEIVEDSSGKIWAENRSGRGARFVIELPVTSTADRISQEGSSQ